jgi:hypothetical protein
MNSISWPDAVQAIAAALALLISPSAVSWLWNRLVIRIHSFCVLTGQTFGQSLSPDWGVGFVASRKILRPVSIFIHGYQPDSVVEAAYISKGYGRGTDCALTVENNGDACLIVSRMPANSVILIAIKFSNADSPKLYADEALVPLNYYRPHLVERHFGICMLLPRIAIMHQRLMLLLVQFVMVTSLLIARLLWLGFAE